MFKSIILRPSSTDNRVDVGVLAEAMVFYQDVELFLGEGALENLVRQIGIEGLFALLGSGHLRLTCLLDIAATHQETRAGREVYDFGTVRPFRRDGTDYDPLDILTRVFDRATAKRGKSRRTANQLVGSVNFQIIGTGIADPAGVSGLARLDLDDREYVQSAVGDALHSMMPGYSLPSGWRFAVHRTQQEVLVETNLDLPTLNREYAKLPHLGHGDSITIAGLICWIQEARADIHLASQRNAELATNEISASIIRRKFRNIIKVTNLDEVKLFTEITLGDGKAIREAINTGSRGIQDLLNLLDEADRFLDWVDGVPEDSNLVGEYARAVTHRGWSERLPSKLTRFFVFSAVGVLASARTDGLAGVLTSVALTAADDLLLDRLISGWKLSQFVTGPLAAFTEE
ncbi:MAG TPA: hypothetical protein VOA80_05315 [Thermoanaerobaculia bacterium]|nr:hypothetical protein [Thermoanaerobaculia bacterium]